MTKILSLPELKVMRKGQLIKYAKENGVALVPGMQKKSIVSAIASRLSPNPKTKKANF